jgi:predicted aspartyl protease
MRSLILFIVLILLLSGCSLTKVGQILKSGTVKPKAFKTEIPFEYRLGIIVIKVKINGTDYNFMLDTGAPNVISKELAALLQLESKKTSKATDSGKNKSEVGFVIVDEITIGDLRFLKTGAAVTNISASKEISCMEIDGIIGSNLMRKAIWQIDYANKKITITNSMDSLHLKDNLEKITFYPKPSGTPVVGINVNGVSEDVIIDTGSNGDIDLSKKTFKKIIGGNPTIPNVVKVGVSSAGLFGQAKPDSSHSAVVNRMAFGDVILEHQIADFGNVTPKIGTAFLKNYDVVLNWFDKEILLEKKSDYDNFTINSFGFSYLLKDNKLIVGSIYKGATAEKKGLRLNDRILSINDRNYETVSDAQWCTLIDKGISGESIMITISRGDEKLSFKLDKEIVLK